jgi:hypothetical protein
LALSLVSVHPWGGCDCQAGDHHSLAPGWRGAPQAVKGVTQIVVLDDVVAVVGEHTGATRKGLSLLDISWDPGPQGQFSAETLTAELEAASKRRSTNSVAFL